MVRVNILKPRRLSDQHLVAEYDEILMLVAYIKKYSSILDVPSSYRLGQGHMKFFKDKVLYLKKRHESLKKEMKKRGFVTNKTIKLSEFNTANKKDWRPKKEDKEIIKKRIKERLKQKPKYYRYYGEYKSLKFFIELLR